MVSPHLPRVRRSLLLALLLPAPLVAQDAVTVTVDYVGVEGIYLAIGSDRGLAAGDTVLVLGDADTAPPRATLVLLSVTRRRSVAEVVQGDVSFSRGQALLLTLPASAVAAGDEIVPDADPASPPASTPGRPEAGTPRDDQGPRVTGRLAFDVDARETRTSWTGDLSGETRRRFATPVTRLSLTASGLPGGFTLRTNLRASYRYSELDFGLPTTTVRAYEVSAQKVFETAPLEVRIGRFYNPFERYSAYWDGLLLRVGRTSGLGAGVVAGFQPEAFNEGFSTQLPKLTGFVDFRRRGQSWRYDTDLSVHQLRPDGADPHLFAGWSQRLFVGRFSLDQRLRLDQSASGGGWQLSQLRLRGTVMVDGPFQLRASYGRTTRWTLLWETPEPGPERQEVSVGGGLAGASGTLYLDGGRTEWLGEGGLYLSGSGSLNLGDARLLLSGRRWERADQSSLSVAPGFSARIAGLDSRILYRMYETEGVSGRIRSHAIDGQLATSFARAFRVTVRGQRTWGENLTGVRLQFGIARRF